MFPRKNSTINRWAALLAVAFMLSFFIIFGRFVYLANAKEVDGHDLINVGKDEWTHFTTIDAHRGEIKGRNGVVLAHDVPAYTLIAVLEESVESHVEDINKTAAALAPILNVDQQYLIDILHKEGAWQVEFGTAGRKLNYDTMKKIKELELPGIRFRKETKRYYPNGSFAPYIIGFTTADKKLGKQVGRLGIERSLNDYLTETDGSITFYSDSEGVIMPEGEQELEVPHDGDTVYLTLDNKIQTVLEDAMSEVYEDYKPHRMIGIVCDPDTGAILAMSNRPTFNPNIRDIERYNNIAISEPYEPGSVMKAFTLAAAIDQGVWNGQETYKSGTYQVNDVPPTIHDWQQNWGTITFNQGFIRSSNTAFARVVDLKLGPENFYKYLERFGFTEKTGIDLPNERNSMINFKWRPDQVMTGYGQASAFTPIQIIQAATAIANDGKMMQPYVIEKVVDPNSGKVVKEHKPVVAGHPIKKETAAQVRELMRKVVTDEDHGTGNNYQIENYEIIGKTGTAQIAVGGQGYLTGAENYIFSFLGMAPKDDPELIVYIAIDRPDLNLEEWEPGSVPVSKVFKPVMKNALQYMKVYPSGQEVDHKNAEQTTIKVDDWTGQSMNQAKQALAGDGLKVVTIGSGTVKKQSIVPNLKVFKGSMIILVGEGSYKMPSLSGWSLSEVLRLVKVLDLKPNVSGHGFVTSQKPANGATVKKGDTLTIELQPYVKPEKEDKTKEDTQANERN